MAANGEAQRIREAAGISARHMAQAIAVSPTTLTTWEAGTAVPHPAGAERWFDQLDALRDVVKDSPAGTADGTETTGVPASALGPRSTTPS